MLEKYSLLSLGEAGFYLPGFLNSAAADHLLEYLTKAVPWQQQAVKLFGRSVKQPRLTAFYGDEKVNYRYSGLALVPLPWNERLKRLKHDVENAAHTRFNSALLNLYRHGQDYMGWHRDNEKSLGDRPVIASVSLGTARKFQLRAFGTKTGLTSIELAHGSLLVMRGDSQHLWEHRLPKVPDLKGPRINITFRNIITRDDAARTGRVKDQEP